MAKKKLKEIAVSKLKNELLDVVRAVERGESFQVTKDRKAVALLVPMPATTTKPYGYSKIKIEEDVFEPIDGQWTFDGDNIK